jgi:hypothetical protein
VNRANFSVQPIIQAQDVSGNVVDDYTSSVSIAVSRSASAVAFGISGTALRNASAGVATFTGLGLFGETGDYTLTYSSGDLTTTSQTLRLTHGVATQIKIVDGSTRVLNGAEFGRSISTRIQDQDGNTVTTGSDATALVTLTPSGATLTGTRSNYAISGIASFTDLVMTGEVGSKSITASTATFTSAPYAVTLAAGAATKLVLTNPASGFVNRVAFSTQPTVMIQDSSGNVVANHNQSITVTRTAVDPSKPATLTGDRTVAAGNGVVTFTNLRLEGKVGEFDLTFESGSLSSTTQRVTLTHGAATAIVLTGATTASNARAIASNVVAEIQDADGNRITSGSNSNQQIVMTASGAVLTGTDRVNASSGVATFSNLTLTATAGTKRLTATITSPSTITGIRDIELAHGEATQLVLTTSATGAVNRSAFTTQPVVSVRDVSGNPVSDFVGRVSVAVSSSGANSAVISGTAFRDLNGSPTATFTGLGLNGDVGDYTLSFTHSTLTAPSQSITLAHGSANYLSISSPASASNSQTLGTAIDVDIKDVDGNLITTGTPEVTLTIAGAAFSGNTVRNAAEGTVSFTDLKIIGLAGTKTFTVSVASPISLTDTETITLNHGSATKVVVTTSASGAVNRANFTTQPVVSVQDVSGNPVSNFVGRVSVSAVSAGSNTLTEFTGTLFRDLNGTPTATFTDLKLNGKVGNYTLTFATGVLTSATQSITLAHGSAHSLAITGSALAANATNFASSMVVRILDEDQNTVTTGSQSTQSVVITAADAVITGTTSRPAVAGEATFPGLKLTGVAGPKVLTATISSPSSITETKTVQLGHGSATQLSLSIAATGAVNRQVIATQATIRLLDVSGNLVENYADQVSVAVSPSGAALTGTLSRTTTSSGVVAFSGIKLNGTVGTYTLTYSSGSLPSITQSIDLTHGTATNLLVEAPASSANAQELASAVVVRVRDADNNLVTSSTDQVSLSVSGAALSGTAIRNAESGIATFPGLALTGTEGTKRFTASVSTPSSYSAGVDIELTYGTATKLEIVTAASGAVNRTAFTTQPSIRALDVSGNEVDNFNNNISVAVSPVGATLTGTTTRAASGSTSTFTDLELSGTLGTYTLTYSAAGLTDATQTISLAHGSATTLELVAPSTADNAREISTAVVVRLKDADGNLVTTGTPEISLSISGATISGTAVRNLSSGQVSFPGLKFVGLTGTKTLSASISTPVSLTTTRPVQLSFGDATKLVVTTEATGAVNRENFTTQPAVTVQDVSGNPVTNFSGTVTLASPVSGAVLSGTTTRVLSGTAVAYFNDLALVGEVGSYTLSFSSGALTPGTQSIQLTHGAATSVELAVTSSAVNNQGISDVVVRIEDADGNLITTGTPSVSLAGSSTELTGTLVRNAASGIATFPGLKFLGTTGNKNVSATVASLSLNSTTSVVNVSAGVATEIVLTTSATGAANRAGISTTPVVTIRDISGNTVTTSSANVSVAVTPVGSATAALSGTASRTPTLGVVSFTGLGLNGQVGSYTLTYSSSGLANITQVIDLTHGAATKVAIATSATTARAGLAFGTQPVIRILDQDNNLVTTGAASTQTVVASLTGLSSPEPVVIAGDVDITASGGQAVFTDLRLNGKVSSYTIRYAAGSLTTASQSIQLVAGNVSALKITTGPANAVAGAGFASDVELKLVDAYENVVLSDSTTDVTATLVASGDVSSRGVSTTTVRVVNGIADFGALNYTLAGDHKIRFSDDTREVFSNSFTITHAAASKLAWVTQPGSMRNDLVVGITPSVRVLDAYNNAVTSGPSVTVTASVIGSNANFITAISGESATTSAGSEVVTLTNFRLKGKVSDYVIRISGSVSGTPFANDSRISSAPTPLGFGLPSQRVITEEADGARAGVAFDTQPELEIRDNSDNLVADSTLRVTATVAGRTLVGTSAVSASGGVVSFGDLGIQGSAANGLVIRYTTQYPAGTPLEATQTIDLTAGTSVKLSIIQQPGTVLTREEFDNDISVQLLDQYDNPVPVDSTTNVSVQLYKGLSRALATGGSTLTLTAVRASSGVATFTGLELPVAPGDDYFLKFTIGSFTITSAQFEVLPGAVASITIADEDQPSSAVGSDWMETGALLTNQPQVTLRDADGYVARGASGSVSVAITTGANGSLSEGSESATISNGVARFAGVRLVGTPSQLGAPAVSYKLTFSYNGINSVESNVLKVTNAEAASLSVFRGASGGVAGEAFPSNNQPIIRILDRYGNIVETGNDAGLVIVASSPDGGDLGGGGFEKQAVAGVATFTSLGLGGTAGQNYSLKFEAVDEVGIASATQTGVTVTHGAAYKLAITQAPASLSGGALTKTGTALATQPIVQVQDRFNNVVLNSSRSVSVTLVRVGATSDVKDRITGGQVSASSGVATFSALTVIARPGSDYRLKFSGTNLVDAFSSTFQIRHADPTAIEITTQPGSLTSSGALTKTGSPLHTQTVVRLVDFDGNLATEITGDSISAFVQRGGGSVITELDGNSRPKNTALFSGGIATFTNLSVVAVPGSEQVLRYTTTVRGNTLTSADSTGVTLTHADAYQLSILTQSCAGAVVSGVCDTGITGDDLLVQPVIEIQDRFGNRVTDFVGEVTVSTTTARTTLSDDDIITPSVITATVSGGLAGFTGLNMIADPGVGVVLNFTSGSLVSANAAEIKVRAAAASQLAVITQPVGARTGAALAVSPVVELRDRFGNRAASDDTSRVSVTVSGGVLSGTMTLTATAGRVNFSDLSFTAQPKLLHTLIFSAVDSSANALTGVSSADFFVSNALANTLAIRQQPTALRTGDLLGEAIVELRDFAGNIAEDDSATVVRVSITAGDGQGRFVNGSDQTENYSSTSTILRSAASAGVVRFSNLRLVGTPGVTYRLLFTANPDDPAADYDSPASAALVLTHAEPSALSVTTWPAANLTGQALTTQPALRLLDRYGNLATLDNSTVVTASIYSGAGGALTAGTTATSAGGVVTFSGLTATGTPGELYKLRFTAGSITVDETTGFRLKKNADISLSYPVSSYVAGGTVSKTFSTDSPGAVSYSTDSSPSICEVNSSTGIATIRGVGDCMIRVTVDNSTYYNGGTENALLKINKADQDTLSITSATSVNYLSTMTITRAGGSGGGTVRLFVSGADCRLVGTTLITMGAGNDCFVFARKGSDPNYKQADSEEIQITVNRIAQAALRMANAATVTVGRVELFTRGGSGDGLVTYTITGSSSPNPGCQIVSGTTLRADRSGTCSVMATKATSTNYRVAISTEQTVAFIKAEQSVFFTSPLPELPVAGGLHEPRATASSGLAVTYSISIGNGVSCEFDADEPNKIRFLASGNCEITATQVGSDEYEQASTTRLIEVGFRNQTITFGSLADRRFGQPAFMLTATASSGMAVSYAVDRSVTPVACSISATGVVSLTASGICSIIATQGGDSRFRPATPVTQLFRVAADNAGAPHVISVSAGNQSITALFNPPSYVGGSTPTAYRLEATIVGTTERFVNPGCVVSNAPIRCTIQGLDNDLNYTVRVAAINEAGIGTYSQNSLQMTPTESVSAVTNLAATPSGSQLNLTWSAPLALDSSFSSYEVFVWPIGGTEPSTPTEIIETQSRTSVSFEMAAPAPRMFRMFSRFSAPTLTTITKADGYFLKVVTKTTGVSDEDLTNTTIGAQQSFSTPGVPAAIEVNANKEKVLVGWSAPKFDGGHQILGYRVMVNNQIACVLETVGGQQVCKNSADRIFEITELAAGTTYDVKVAAVNSLGVGVMASGSHSVPAPVVNAPSSSTALPGLLPTKPVPPKKPGAPDKKPGLPPPAAAPEEPAEPEAPAEEAPPAAPSDPGAAPSDPGVTPGIGATGDDNAPPVPFDPLSSPEGVAALTDSLGNAAAAVGAIAAAAAAAAAAAGAAGAAAGGGSSGGSGSSGSGGQGNQGGSIATIDAAHERFTNRRRGRGDKWKIWKKKWLSFSDKFSIATVVKSAKFSPLFSKIAVDGAYLRAAFGSLGLLPTIAAAAISVMTVSMNEGAVLTPQWQWFIVLAVIGIFDAFAGLVGTVIFVAGTVVMHGGVSSMDDVRLLLGVIIVGYGPALLANAFRAFRKEPEEGEEYWWERLVDLVVLPFIGGWVTATMISILPALAGTTMAVANHVNEFAVAIAIAITIRVVFEEFVGRWFPARLDTLHPTDVDDPAPYQKWISVAFRLAVFVFVTAALMGNVWQVWVGSALFILPTIIGFYAHKFKNYPWIWRIMPSGIPGLAFALIVASVTTSIVNSWFGSTPDLALWSFALLPIPMLGIAILAMIGREGNEGEIRWIRRPGFKWVYRIGGIFMLLATMELAGVLDIFPF